MMTATMNIEQEFQAVIVRAGIEAPSEIIADGEIHRFSTNGRRGDTSGWYILHGDGIPAGAFGCWRQGITQTWSAKADNEMTDAERRAHRERMEAVNVKRKAAKALAQAEAATSAALLWSQAKPATAHAYLKTKGIQPHGARADGASLLIAMRDADGAVCSLQTISPEGDKRFHAGGKVTGCYYSIGKPDGKLIVCEGFATGASIHECTGLAVAVAFNAGNLQAVAQALHGKYAALQIIVAADDDYRTAGNPGLSKAREAAQSVGGLVAVPDFGSSRPDGATDFNDLHQTAGGEAVKRCIEAAMQCKPDADVWPELQPLTAQIEPQDYPLDALPDAIRLAVVEVGEFVKAPVPMLAGCALSSISLAAQAHVDVRRAEKLHGPVSLYMLTIADSGERKSTVDGFFTKAIRDYEDRVREGSKPALSDYEADLAAWQAQKEGIDAKIKELAKNGKPSADKVRELKDLTASKPQKPRVPKLILGDTTSEALGYSLAKDWPSGGIVSSEAGIVFGGHAMGSESMMRNFAMLNQLWDGATLPVSRRSAESYTVKGARLTMALQVQESTIRAFFDNTRGLARGTGFLARFLIAWPQSTQGSRMFTEAPASWPALTTFNSRLTAILERPVPIDENGALTPAMLTLSPEAKAAWVDFHNGVESMLGTGGELIDIRDVASKTADNAARLAALIHTFNGSIGPIDAAAMGSAIRIVAWHLNEARRFLGEFSLSADLVNPARLEAWLIEYCRRERSDYVPTREILRCGPSGLRDKKKMDEAIAELAELGRVREVQEGKKRQIQVRGELLQ